ncbi:FxLYD domain-containing protein [Streptomyces violens]|uniref:FxLYD domain-containing protein n=1 Tax=Streptomyces violens TaxID=66377 RepID=UPI0004BFB915|nr:FxLYD domain-containing protein [Streptomyces violens]
MRRTVRSAVPAALAACAAASALALSACSTDNGNDADPSVSARPTAPDTSNFSGEPPSALASKKAEVKESASKAAESASQRAHDFEASVSADVERNRQEFTKELDKADGRGNAMKDVSLTGKPLAQTNGVRAQVVNITNSTDETASYAVRVDFRDADGKVVESTVVGAKDVKPGDKAQPLAISTKPPEPHLTAKIAKAQRY